MFRRALAAADSTPRARRLEVRCGLLARAAVLATVGAVLVAATRPVAHAQPGDNWFGKRVMERSPDFQLEIENRLVHPRIFDIYRVEKVDGPRLRLRAEREGLSGWALSEHVVPIPQAIAYFTEYIKANPDDPFGYTMRAIIWEREKKELDRAIGDYNEVIRLNPTRAYAYNNRGISGPRRRSTTWRSSTSLRSHPSRSLERHRLQQSRQRTG